MQELTKTPRPISVEGITRRVRTACGNLYVTVTYLDSRLFEVFARLGKAGGCMMSNMEALTVAITMGIRHGILAQVYIDKLKGVRCQNTSLDEGVQYTSCADAVAKVMEEVQKWLESRK